MVEKKGPWTPEEDITLVSYIQEHGPGNWKSVPINTGLLRSGKSCRLRWINYLRPGIKRGNFTQQEDRMIIHLQALLGNRWAAMASYLPQRTDNDIKNYWNAHLKKRLNNFVSDTDQENHNRGVLASSSSCSQPNIIAKGQWERQLQTNIHMAKQALSDALSLDNKFAISSRQQQQQQPQPGNLSTTTYPSSVENISRLLPNWLKSSPKSSQTSSENTSAFNNRFLSRSTSEGFKNYNNLEASETTSLLQERKLDTEAQMSSFSFLENGVFDDATAQHYGFVN
ncbi:hypothetical protein M8C21_017323, partial [Ambrosia artemisiifolia]